MEYLEVVEVPPKVPQIQKYSLSKLTEVFDSAVVEAVNCLREIVRHSEEEYRIKAALVIIKTGEYLLKRSQMGQEVEELY